MRKRETIAGLLALGLLCMAGCSRLYQRQETPPVQQAEEEPPAGTLNFGTYDVPQGWVVAPQYSSQQKLFYVQQGQKQAARPDNISVEEGSNLYAKEEHEQFRSAILSQLMMQLRNQPGVQLEGEGTHTAAGDVLYIFTIREEDTGIVTRQFYIVGDKRYCLIHETNFSGEIAADDAARAMADSFVWQQDE